MFAAIVFSALALVVAVYQLGLAAGMPWGNFTWGGKFPGRLPAQMRLVALLSTALLVAFAFIVSIRAGILWRDWQPISRMPIWLVVAYCALGVFANAATSSRWERRVWLPVVLAMLVSSVIVGMG